MSENTLRATAESSADGTHHDMETTRATSDEKTEGGGPPAPPCAGLTSDVLPDAPDVCQTRSKPIGVSTDNAFTQSASPPRRWYALRTTYGRELKANLYLKSKGLKTFCPTIKTVKLVQGKRREIEESRIPNIFFVHGTFSEVKAFVYDNVNLPYLRFYYTHHRTGRRIERIPVVVPDYQMESLMRVCNAESSNTIFHPGSIPKFASGQLVRITGGPFSGVVGRVAKYKGQQRVAVIVEGLVTACTAYVPGVFLVNID